MPLISFRLALAQQYVVGLAGEAQRDPAGPRVALQEVPGLGRVEVVGEDGLGLRQHPRAEVGQERRNQGSVSMLL